MDIRSQIESAAGAPVTEISPFGGGCIGQVYHVQTADGSQLVAKVEDGPDPRLDIEAYMLDYLRSHSSLPVPRTIVGRPELLLMTYLPGESSFPAAAEIHAAELLADLHNRSAPAYGLERSTLIGGLHQPNSWSDAWIPFFAEQRLRYMAGQGVNAGRLPVELCRRIDRFIPCLTDLLEEPAAPALIHGDVWTTNVLAANGRVTGFLDPAIYYGSPEIELAFITLFNTFGESFFRRYEELRPLSPGFFEERRDIYNLYPLLVHVRLFGGSYVSSVDRILSRFGF